MSGRAWFHALGQRMRARGYHLHGAYVMAGMIGGHVPAWASNAFINGWVDGGSK